MPNIGFDLIIISLILSLLGNLSLYIYITKIVKKKPEATYDVRALLADLATGPALLKIEYVDRGDVLLRSPRHFS